MPKSRKTISIRDIADIAGVSVATVSRVINENGRFSEATRQRVQDVIDEYGYVTNMAARSLRQAKSKTVGIIIPDILSDWFAFVVTEVERRLFDADYSTFICNTSRDEEKEAAYLRTLDSKLVDGLICIAGSDSIPMDAVKRNIPVVCIDRRPNNLPDAYLVESDHYQGGKLAAQELLRCGVKHPAYLSRRRTISAYTLRLEGFRQELLRHGIPLPEECIVSFSTKTRNERGAHDATMGLIKAHPEIDGIFASNDWRAVGAIAAVHDLGLSVPNDIRIVGFDDSTFTASFVPSITTIRQDVPQLAQRACTMLLSLMSGNPVDTRKAVVPVQLIARESTGAQS